MIYRYFYTLRDIIYTLNKYEIPKVNTRYISLRTLLKTHLSFSKYNLIALLDTAHHFNLIEKEKLISLSLCGDSLSNEFLLQSILKDIHIIVNDESFKESYNNYFIEEKKFYIHSLIQHFLRILLLKHFHISDIITFQDIEEVKLYYFFNRKSTISFLEERGYACISDSNSIGDIDVFKNLFFLFWSIVPSLFDCFFRSLFLLSTFISVKTNNNEYLITNLFNDKDNIQDYLEESKCSSIEELRDTSIFFTNDSKTNSYYSDSFLSYSYKNGEYTFYKKCK